MPALGHPVVFNKSSGPFQESRNIRALTIMFFSQPSLKYLSLSMRMLKEQCSLQKGALCVYAYAYMCSFYGCMWTPCVRPSVSNGVQWYERTLLDFLEVPRVLQFCLAPRLLRVGEFFCCLFDSLYPLAGRGFSGLDLRGMKRTFWTGGWQGIWQ